MVWYGNKLKSERKATDTLTLWTILVLKTYHSQLVYDISNTLEGSHICDAWIQKYQSSFNSALLICYQISVYVLWLFLSVVFFVHSLVVQPYKSHKNIVNIFQFNGKLIKCSQWYFLFIILYRIQLLWNNK